MGIAANTYFTGRTPVSIGPNKDPGADLEAFAEQLTLSVENGEVETNFLVNVVSPKVNVLAAAIAAPTDGADASSALNAAVTVAKAFAPLSCEILLPRGTYTIDASKVLLDASGLIIEGQGPGNTVLKAKTGSSITSAIHFGLDDGSATVTSYCGLRNMTVDGNGECSTAVVRTWNIQDFRMENVEVKGGAALGMLMETEKSTASTKSKRNKIIGCRFHSNGTSGFKNIGDRYLHVDETQAYSNGSIGMWVAGFENTGLTYAGATEVFFGNVESYSNASDGFFIDRVAQFTGVRMSAFANGGWSLQYDSSTTSAGESNSGHINHLICDGGASGGVNIQDDADVSDLSIGRLDILDSQTNAALNSVGFKVRGAKRLDVACAYISGQRGNALSIVSGNPLGVARESTEIHFGRLTAVDNGDASAASNSAVIIGNSSSDITFSYLHLANSQTSSGSDYELNISSSTVKRVKVLSGYIEANTAGQEISVVSGALGDVLIAPAVSVNDGTDAWSIPSVASAATLNLPAHGTLIDVTGTTAITAFGKGYPGRQVSLRFPAGASWPAVSDSATAKLAGVFTAAGDDDLLSMVADESGVWRETSRSVN